MSNESVIPSTARCLGCGYLLRGLPTPVCPECGRGFDPSDPTSYDVRPPGWRRRRRIKVACVVGAAGLVLFALFPRALLTSMITFNCSVCWEQATVWRWEPKPPRWVPFRYPGVHWMSRRTAAEMGAVAPCRNHTYNVFVRFDMHSGGRAFARGSLGPGDPLTFNGMETSVKTAPKVLKHLMDPLNNGIGP